MFPSKITVDSVGQNGHEQDSLTIQNMTRSHRQRLNIDLAPPKLHYSQEYLQLLELLDRSLLHQLPIQLSVCCCYRQLPHHTSHATHTPSFLFPFPLFLLCSALTPFLPLSKHTSSGSKRNNKTIQIDQRAKHRSLSNRNLSTYILCVVPGHLLLKCSWDKHVTFQFKTPDWIVANSSNIGIAMKFSRGHKELLGTTTKL